MYSNLLKSFARVPRIAKFNTNTFARNFSSYSIVEQHKSFIDLVKDHGTGDINLEETSPGILTLTISNPTKKNALSGRMMYQLGLHVDEIIHSGKYESAAWKGLVITGTDGFFCAGVDFGLAEEIVNTPELGYHMSKYLAEALDTLFDSHLISVAVLNGPAVGGGSEFSIACDFRIIHHDCYIQFVHSTIGCFPGLGCLHRMIKLVGRNKALRALGTGSKIYPLEAHEIGLVDETIEPADFNHQMPRIHGEKFLQEFFKLSYPGSVAAIKKMVSLNESHSVSEEELTELEAETFETRWLCPDNVESIKRFRNRQRK